MSFSCFALFILYYFIFVRLVSRAFEVRLPFPSLSLHTVVSLSFGCPFQECGSNACLHPQFLKEKYLEFSMREGSYKLQNFLI